jgi:hypothetical protein
MCPNTQNLTRFERENITGISEQSFSRRIIFQDIKTGKQTKGELQG